MAATKDVVKRDLLTPRNPVRSMRYRADQFFVAINTVPSLGWDHIVLTGDYDWNSGAAECTNVRPLNLYPEKIRA